jgi:starvation-inducible DNA-binding protein
MKKPNVSQAGDRASRRKAPARHASDLKAGSSKDIAAAMNGILADVFALYLKDQELHCQRHMRRAAFRDYQSCSTSRPISSYAMTDPIAERIRKVGGTTLRSIGHIARMQRIADNDAEFVEPLDMLAELRDDNKTLAARLREATRSATSTATSPPPA